MRLSRPVLAALAASLVLAAALAVPRLALAQSDNADLTKRVDALQKQLEDQRYTFDQILKGIDDVLWFERVGDVAMIDKVYITGPPNPKETPRYGIADERHPVKFWAYTFVPRKLAAGKKAPLIVLPHGGVHADFTTYHTHIVRELMEQGYVVIAPEYRGSTGYGAGYENAIDYGGLEVDDCVAARDWAVENLPADGAHAAMVGWSHGGLIALLAVYDHPEKFACCFAGVPVSDLVMRMGYAGPDYQEEFARPNHLGQTAEQNVDEYRRRSPAWNASKLRTPLLIHTTTNDRDVNSIEVEELIAQLRAAGKDFQYKVYKDAPGGHSFDRIDTAFAHESRREIWAFLAKHLK